jgi:chemotaxis methyl-accepting protein methylase
MFNWELLDEDFDFFCHQIHSIAGIYLKCSKRDLVYTRLRSRVEHLGLKNFSAYRNLLSGLNNKDPEWQMFINLLTTNKTDFFREPKHFDFLIESYLPVWIKKKSKTLKIWSCAASTGEEPFTIAMILNRSLPKDLDFKILATDIDTKVLSLAENGVYSNAKLGEIPDEFHSSLTYGKGEVEGWFSMKDCLRQKISYQQHNLVETAYPNNEMFDIIFCRNLLIYFNKETIESVINKLYERANPGAILFIGHAESLQGIETKWKLISPSIFIKD